MNSNLNENVQTLLNQKQIDLEKNRDKLIEGLLIRSRTNWHENGEKCSHHFCKLEKKNLIHKTMKRFRTDDETYCQHNVKLTEGQKYL